MVAMWALEGIQELQRAITGKIVKYGSQHARNTPMMKPSCRAALVSLTKLKFVDFVLRKVNAGEAQSLLLVLQLGVYSRELPGEVSCLPQLDTFISLLVLVRSDAKQAL